MKILIGVDESSFSETALSYVKGISWPSGSTFRVVSASPPVFMGAAEVNAPAVIAQLIRDQEAMHREIADRAAKALQAAGLAAEGVMMLGDPRSTLVEEARRMGADLVVVGSHGRSGLSKLLLGSVAAHVSSNAPCSVLIVKRPGSAP